MQVFEPPLLKHFMQLTHTKEKEIDVYDVNRVSW